MTEAAPQREVIAFLETPEAHGAPATATVTRIETHISVIFLVGDDAYKLKRAVRFDYLDFSTLEARRRACEAEIAINRRTAPMLYLGVVAVTRAADGALALGGDGPAVEWLVHMRRFDQDGLFDRLARRGALDPAIMTALAEAIAAFHRAAEIRRDKGGRAGMAWVIAGNAADFAAHPNDPFDPEAVERLVADADAALDRLGALLDARRAAGRVRHCHGDLHLGNICLIDGAPLLFDAIEFNDDIACCDVLYDLAFLIMDLLHRRLGGLANLVLNRYLEITDDLDGLAALGFFLSCRAAVRAKIAATAAATTTSGAAPSHRRGLRAEARAYLDQANAYLAPAPPRLIAIGGLSGTGKSTLARRLAPAIGAAPGAVILRSDVVRKRLFGVAPTDKLPATAYAPAVSRRVYDVLAADAGRVLDAGHAVIVDAVHADARERARIAAVAGARNVAFAGLWLDAAPDRLIARVEARQGDASDADAAIVRRQLDYDLGTIDWRRIAAEGAPATVARRAKKALSACKSSS